MLRCITTGVALLAFAPGLARAQSLEQCRSPNPADWPSPAKPYFMLAADTSGSMTTCINDLTNPSICNDADEGPEDAECADTNSCGSPNTRINGAKCAFQQTVQTFAGAVNFGLASFGGILSNCPANCTPCPAGVRCDCMGSGGAGVIEAGFVDFDDNGDSYGCRLDPLPNAANFPPSRGCGNQLTTAAGGCTTGATFGGPFAGSWRNGGNILVPLLEDPPTGAEDTNVDELLEWFDNTAGSRCDNNRELWAMGATPLEGILRTVHHYLTDGWDPRWGTGTYCASDPFAAGDYPRFGAPDLSNPCRPLRVILVTDGEETCNGDGATAATALNQLGVLVHVIGFANASGVATANFNAIAAAGGTTEAILASNEAELAQALAGVISDAIQPEVCDNQDNNCNGCIDEGHQVYCSRDFTPRPLAALQVDGAAGECCEADAAGERDACLAAYQASVTAGTPQRWLLPCWDPIADGNPEASWLCSNPGEICDELDNNCELSLLTPADDDPGFDVALIDENAADEGFEALKCEYDDSHDGLECPIDEVCDGADQNCDGVIDNDPATPDEPFSVPGPGGESCEETLCFPSAEVCNGCDDDCDGEIDENPIVIPCGLSDPVTCSGTQTCQAVAGGPFAPGACNGADPQGTYSACTNTINPEICDGVDNDCNGIRDDNPTDDGDTCAPPGYTVEQLQPGLCQPGVEECQSGALVCVGYTLPSTEVCDTFDNDCDDLIDQADPDLTGVGNPCGISTGICEPGVTACENGDIVCNDPSEALPEVCDGLDNDCDGPADNGLSDIPSPANCWPDPNLAGCATLCSYTSAGITTEWCAPAGATCNGFGTLDPTATCALGTLVCAGASGWICQGGVLPRQEVCDGEDNDCDGEIDEELDDGGDCGSNIGECVAGILACVDGVLVCEGEVEPVAEICDGLDNNCNGINDDGIGVGGQCEPEIDRNLYPNADLNEGICEPGQIICTPEGAQTCQGGVGPQPEVCDGIDNDCDGDIDEPGPAPDGIDGTSDPFDDQNTIGDSCGAEEGACEPGQLGCVEGRVVCVGGIGPRPEICDCLDNNCDGTVDEASSAGENPICASAGDVCAERNPGVCQCFEPCGGTEFPCPGGTVCQTLPISGSDDTRQVCVGADPCAGGCGDLLVRDSSGAIECGPPGTLPGSGTRPIPECTCRGELGCHSPCFNVLCDDGTRCVEVGPFVQQCRPDNNCNLFGCPGTTTCYESQCVDNPCLPNPCAADEVCKPSADFSGPSCVGSCADVSCSALELCRDGECVPTGCSQSCDAGNVCRDNEDGDTGCFPTLCESPCSNGAYCDPTTGACGTDPCSGVVCPEDQYCVEGECNAVPEIVPPTGEGGGGAGGGATTPVDAGVGGEPPAAGSGGQSAGDPPPGEDENEDPGIYGLVTGGGGCACRTGPAPRHSQGGSSLLLSAVIAGLWIARRRRARAAAADAQQSKQRSALAALLSSLFLGGCETEAYCFDDCQSPNDLNGSGAQSGLGPDGGSAGSTLDPNVDPNQPGQEPGGAMGIDIGGGADGGVCTPGTEVCDGRDNDCDAVVDEDDPDLAVNTLRVCGNCETDCVRLLRNTDPDGVSCAPPSQAGDPGDCSFEACLANFYDVDGNPGNGCEYFCPHNPDGAVSADTGGAQCNTDDDCDGELDEDVDLCGDVNNCGRCGARCNLANASPSCETTAADPAECGVDNTSCVVEACADGFVDRDGLPENGCEYGCTPSGAEVCDGIDNDCDGNIDNADDDLGGIGGECFGGEQGACSAPENAGKLKCIAGQLDCCDIGSDEVVNDNAVVSPQTGPRNGVCQAAAGDPNRILRPNDRLELCNDEDDDCDGTVDDAPTDTGGACGIGFGICPSGVMICQNNTLTCSVSANPQPESCDGIDNDCDGIVDGTRPASIVACSDDGDCLANQHCLVSAQDGGSVCANRTLDEGSTCDEPPPAPCVLNGLVVDCSTASAVAVEQPCAPGLTACIGGVLACEGAVGSPQASDLCGEDTNCDGTIELPDFENDESNCGGCQSLAAGSPVPAGDSCPPSGADGNAVYQCQSGICEELNCAPGYIKCPGDSLCQACTASEEVCDGVDNDCDCSIDEDNPSLLPSVEQACGVPAGQADPRCEAGDGVTGIRVFCDTQATPVGPACDFPPGVCTGASCSATLELCDGIDNDCNGAVDEDFTIAVLAQGYLGQTCHSDDSAPEPGDGACRTEGEYVCTDDGTATECDAVRNENLIGQELCDGVDNDCDGFIDEIHTDGANGADDGNFIAPDVTLVSGVWIYRYEASRPSATAASPGFGNGYHVATMDVPSGTSLDATLACSTSGRIPWVNVTPIEAQQTCAAMGGRLCDLDEWQDTCQGTEGNCGFANENDCSVNTCGAACDPQTTPCNVHAYDFDTGTSPTIEDGLLPGGALELCRQNWPDQAGAAYDLTGNVWEITMSGSEFVLMGGSYISQANSGITCTSTFFNVAQDYQLFDAGFRCCFDDDPTVLP